MLVQREQEITSLRTGVTFYERLAGPTGGRQRQAIHSIGFARAGGRAWMYCTVLIQDIDRGDKSAGRMCFAVEGT